MDLDQAPGDLDQAAGALERHLAGQLAAALARPGAAEMGAALAAAGAVYREIAPQDALEKLLAVQMIAGHEAALDGFARARVAEDEPARRSELRLAARLSALFARQAGTLRRHRAEARRADEAAERRAARKAAKAQAEAQEVARPRGGGVLVVPRSDPPEAGRPWPEPEGLAAALAQNRARAEDSARAQARSGTAAPGRRARAGGAVEPGYLVVPGTVSPEEWTRRVREHHRRLREKG